MRPFPHTLAAVSVGCFAPIPTLSTFHTISPYLHGTHSGEGGLGGVIRRWPGPALAAGALVAQSVVPALMSVSAALVAAAAQPPAEVREEGGCEGTSSPPVGQIQHAGHAQCLMKGQ